MRNLRTLFSIILLMFCSVVLAGTDVGGVFYYVDDNDMTAVAGRLTGTETVIVIPNVIEVNEKKYIVTKLESGIFQNSQITSVTFVDDFSGTLEGDRMFEGCSELTSAVLPTNLTVLPTGTFEGCEKLKTVVLSPKMQAIGYAAFKGCVSLTTIQLPKTLEKIGDDAFEGCSSLSNAELFNGLTGLGSYAFAKCGNLKSICIPASLEAVGNKAFEGCSFKTFKIEDGTTPIGLETVGCTAQELYLGRKVVFAYSDWTPWTSWNLSSLIVSKTADVAKSFGGCISLKSVEILVDTIAERAFEDCTALESVTFSSSLDSIGDGAFARTGLFSVQMPVSAQHLGMDIFANCPNLASVQLEDGMQKIPVGFLEGCSSLSEIVLPKSIKRIGNGAFSGSSLSKINIPDGMISIGGGAFAECKLDSIYIPNKVEKIEESTFFSCKTLKAIVIGKNVKSIGDAAFHNLKNLRVYYNGTLEDWCKINFLVSGYPEDTNPLSNASQFFVSDDMQIVYEPVVNLVIPESVDSIPAYAFINFKGLKTVEIPASVKYIGEEAFAYGKFTEATIHSEIVGEAAFSACTRLKKLLLGQEFKKAEESAFYYTTPSNLIYDGAMELWCKLDWEPHSKPECFSLSIGGEEQINVVVPYTVPHILPYAFYGSNGIETVTISRNTRTIDKSAFSGCQKLKKIDWKRENKAKTLAFYAESADGATVGEYAFSSCRSLETVSLTDNLTSIGQGAFDGDNNLIDIQLPTTVKRIGRYAFEYTKWLDSQSDGVVYVGNVAYIYKGKLPENAIITLKDGCSAITDGAFESSWENKYATLGLKEIVMPNTVSYIGEYAFNGCENLKSIALPSELQSIEAYTFNDCKGIESLEIPSSVKNISGNAFKGTSIRSLRIPDTVSTLSTIEGDSLKSLVIEDGIDTLFVKQWLVATDSLQNLYLGRNVKMSSYYKTVWSENFKKVEVGKNVENLASLLTFAADTIPEIYVYSPIPPIYKVITKEYNPFYDIYYEVINYAFSEGLDKTATTLYVPQGSLEAYANAEGWKDFLNIKEFVPSSISGVKLDDRGNAIIHYDLMGHKISPSQKGVHIIKYANGTSKKMVVQ